MKMVISKVQYIKKIHEAELAQIDNARILGRFDDKSYVFGMETKYMLDVAAALLDHEVESGAERIDDGKMAGILGTDWKLHKTVFMNLENMQ
jgi:hypothetical protein